MRARIAQFAFHAWAASALTLIPKLFAMFASLFPAYSSLSRSHPGYFGKVGMRYFHKTNNQYFCKTINVDKLFTLVDAETVKAAEERKASGEALVLDVTKHGIMKVLGNGRLPALPIVVKARFFSKLAEKKIKEAGGVCELTA